MGLTKSNPKDLAQIPAENSILIVLPIDMVPLGRSKTGTNGKNGKKIALFSL